MENPQRLLQQAKLKIDNNVVNLIESIFRIRDSKGILQPYLLSEPHKNILTKGMLGDRSALTRIINKGRQNGTSYFTAVEAIMIAEIFPHTYQYYVATKEKQAKEWLTKVERLALDSRVWVDGSKLIDMDTVHSSQLEKIFRHFDKKTKKKIAESYVCGLAASPAGIRGEHAINAILDEFDWMIQKKDQQRQVYEAIKHFVAEGGQLSIQSTPRVRTDLFWEMYTKADKILAKAFHLPVIANYEDLDLSKDLRKQKLIIPYHWRATPESILKLEQARRDDVEYFKQEVLGIPADVLHRWIPPEMVYPNVNSAEMFLPDKAGHFTISIDVGQKRDLTAITVGQNINGHIWERWIQDSQEKYTTQYDEVISPLIERYEPIEIRIDNTGIGVSIGDMIEEGFSHVPLKRIEYASTIEMGEKKMKIPNYMAEEFKKSLIYGRYHLIDNQKAIQHILRIEKNVTSTTIRYSGKDNGRDDHFWSKAMLNASFIFGGGSGVFAIMEEKMPSVDRINTLGVFMKSRKRKSNSALKDMPPEEGSENFLMF